MTQKSYDFSNATRGAVADTVGKTRITIMIDDDILAAFREQASREGKGYQTAINEALRHAIDPESAPVTVEALRRILREEMHAA